MCIYIYIVVSSALHEQGRALLRALLHGRLHLSGAQNGNNDNHNKYHY